MVQSASSHKGELIGPCGHGVYELGIRSCVCSQSHRLSATLCTIAHQALLSMAFTRQEYWSVLPFPPPEDLPDPGIEPVSLELADGLFITELPHLGSPDISSTNHQTPMSLKVTNNPSCSLHWSSQSLFNCHSFSCEVFFLSFSFFIVVKYT